jgi:hypothetical protein
MKNFRLALVLGLALSAATIAPPVHADVCKTIQAGSVDQTITLKIVDSTDGTPETAVAFNTSGIDLEYWRHGANSPVDITEVTQTVNAAHTDGGFVAVGHGIYRLDLPDAAVAASATAVDVYGTVTGMIVIGCTIPLVPYNPQDGVRLGLTGIPNATPGAAGGLLIAGTNADFDVTANASFSGGISITQSSSNTAALVVTGNGTGNGATFTSGSGATGNGIAATAASTNGNGLAATGTGTGSGLIATAGATGDGLEGVGGSTSGAGIRAAGTAGNSPAMTLVGQGSAAGLLTTGGATGHGASFVGGSTSGDGARMTGSAGNSNALNLVGQGSANGLLATGGATGHGMRLVGGATSGNGISTSHTAPSAGACELGFCAAGTLNGTHSSTTADLGTNAPGATSDLVGMTVQFPTRQASRVISAYDTATGVATWDTALDGDITLANADPWILWNTAPGSGGGGGLDAAGVRAALGMASANLDTQLSTIDNFVDTEVADILTDTSTTLDDLVDDLETRITATRAGYLDKLNITGNVANQGSVDTIDDFLDTEVASIVTQTGAAAIRTALGLGSANLDTQLSGIESGISWNSAWDAEVQSEVDDALIAQNLDHLFTTTYDPASKPGAADALLNELVENDGGVARYTANALEQGPSGGGGGTNITQIEGSDATDVIDARIAAAGLATATNLATLTTRVGTPSDLGSGASLAANASDIEAQTDDIGVAGAGLTAADDAVLAAIAGLNDLSASQVWAAVIEENGSIPASCVLKAIFAYTSGDVVTVGNTATYEDSTGAETRLVITIASAGNRTTVVTCD